MERGRCFLARFLLLNGQLLCNGLLKSFEQRLVDARSLGCDEIKMVLMGGVVGELQRYFGWKF